MKAAQSNAAVRLQRKSTNTGHNHGRTTGRATGMGPITNPDLVTCIGVGCITTTTNACEYKVQFKFYLILATLNNYEG